MSSPDVERTPLQATARRWPTTLLLVVLGTALGVVAASEKPTTYTAETRMAVGGADIKAQAVPGFALASSEIAANYARFVSIGPVRTALTPAQRSALATVTASPLPDSNVIRIEATASDSATAVKAASVAATALESQVAKAVIDETPAAALADFTAIAQQVATAQQQQADLEALVSSLRAAAVEEGETTSAALTRASGQLASVSARVYTLQAQQNALGVKYQNLVNAPASQSQLDIVSPAAASFDDSRSKLQRYGLAGLVLGFLLALVLTTLLERRAARRRRRGEAGVDSGGSVAGSRSGGGQGNAGQVRGADEARVGAEPLGADTTRVSGSRSR